MKKLFIILGLILCFNTTCVYAQENTIDKDAIITEIGTLVNQRSYQTALRKCDEAIKLFPQESSLYYWHAAIMSANGDKERALNDYDKAISFDPQNSKLYVMRGICKYNLKDEKGALQDYNKAIELDNKNSSAYSMRAMIKLDNGDFEGADQDLDKANTLYQQTLDEQENSTIQDKI